MNLSTKKKQKKKHREKKKTKHLKNKTLFVDSVTFFTIVNNYTTRFIKERVDSDTFKERCV